MTATRRGAALALCVALLAPSLLPAATAGTLDTFLSGPSAVLSPGTSTAVASFPNPARAVGATVDLEPLPSVEVVTAAPPAAWGFIFDTCATLASDPLVYRQRTLDAPNLSLIADEDGSAANLSLAPQRPGLLFEVPVPSNFLDPRPWNATLRVAATTDGAQPPDGSTFTLALFAPPGFRPWREVPLSPAADNASVLEGTVFQPATAAGSGGEALVGLLVPNNGSASTLLVDSVHVTLRRLVVPVSPQLIFAGATGSFWQFQYPGVGLDPALGRAHGFMGGAPEVAFPSNGTGAAGETPPFYLPEGVDIAGAFVELVPEAVGGVAASAGGPATAAAGSASAAGAVYVSPVPVVARPVVANVVLSDLVAAGTLDAEQPADLAQQFVGNQTGAERAAAQTLTIESDGTLAGVSVLLRNGSARPVGPLVMEIRNVTASGEPGNLTLATTSFNATEAVLGGWATFALQVPLPVAAGEALAVVVTAPGAASGEYWEWGRHDGLPSDPYTNGSGFVALNASGAGAWNAQAAQDFTFRALLDKPLDPSAAAQVSVAGSIGPGIPSPLPGNRTEYVFTVPGLAVGIDPEAGGGGRWNISVVNALGDALRFNWSAYIDYALYPRNVELRVGDEPPAATVAELDGTRVVDFTSALATALASGNLTAAPGPWGPFHEVPLRLAADGPAALRVRGLEVAYGVTLRVTGFSTAMNQVLSAVAPAEPLAEAVFQLLATEGEVRLSNLSVEYSEAPRFFGPAPAFIEEGAVNATVADLLQLFTDDYDSFNLTYSVLSVFGSATGVATAEVHRSALDANLTVTMVDGEYAGPLTVSVLATDSTGLGTVGSWIAAEVLPLDDPPVVPTVLPDLALPGTSGSFDLAPHILDNDTAPAGLAVTASSPFATVSGLVISFDYRDAPASLRLENVTLTISDGTSQVTALLRVLIENAGRPTLAFPAAGALSVAAGRNLTVDLGAYATDDDAIGNLTWELLLVSGNGTASISAGGTLVVTGHREGTVTATVAVRDRDQNYANGSLVVAVRANLAPRFTALDGSRVTLTAAGPLTIDLREFLSDPDDPFANLSFAVAWDNGSALQAAVEGGVLTLSRPGEAGGHARVTVTATDPSGASAAASVEVDVEGPLAGGPSFLLLLGAVIAAVLLGALLYRSYRRGQTDRRSFSRMAREEGGVEVDEDERRLRSPEGLEPTEEEKMLGKIDEMEREAGAERLELPPITIVGAQGALATTSLLLMYRDGRPVAWVAAAPPSEREAELEQELAAAVGERLKKGPTGARIEGESIEMGGRTFALEARAQLVLAARVEGGPKNQRLRQAMRIALEEVFDRNPGALKRWDGSPRGLKGVDDALEAVMRVAPVPRADQAAGRGDVGEE